MRVEMVGKTLKEQFLLRDDVVYLNHGAFGACPIPVLKKQHEWQGEVEREPTEFFTCRFGELMAEARKSLADYVSCDPYDLVYVDNSTAALSIVIRSLALREGDEVLTTDLEYGACERAWRFVCEKAKARYTPLPVPMPWSGDDAFVEKLWAAVTPKTRVIFLSHITACTSVVLPLEEILLRARREGIMTIVDGAHALGQIPIALRSLDPDVYFASAHKWLCGPRGSGFLYVRKDVQSRIEPLIVSWGWPADRKDISKLVQEQQWLGLRDPSVFLAVPAAIEFQRLYDWEKVRRDCHDLAMKAAREIASMTGVKPLYGDGAYAQMVTVQMPQPDIFDYCARLYDEHRIEVLPLEWNGNSYIRISVQGYNSEADIEALLRAIESMPR